MNSDDNNTLEFNTAKKPPKRQDFINISILIIIAFLIGIYLIYVNVLISKDGTLYINCAKQFTKNNFVETIDKIPTAPGYPFLIYLTHKITGLFINGDSLQKWIVSAQSASLLSKLTACGVLYFVASFFVCRKAALWGVLILNILPDSAEYGSDALSEWPHLMFLSIGFLLLLWGTQNRKSWMFGLAGIAAGLGYLIRSEGCQLIIYGGAWLVFNLVRPEGKMRRINATGALILLLAGFAVVAAPYMKIKGYVFPDQKKINISQELNTFKGDCIGFENLCTAQILGKVTGSKTFVKNVSETLVYYFVPFLLIGCLYYLRKQPKSIEQTFFAAIFIAVNLILLWWQMLSQHFLSRRHTLALIAFTAFYIPIGMKLIIAWIGKKNVKGKIFTEKNKQTWFYILLTIGIVICLIKLFRYTETQKYGYRQAAEWLNKNTTLNDIVAVPDKRLTFYAERNGEEYYDRNDIPRRINYTYVADIIKTGEPKFKTWRKIEEKYWTWVDNKKNKKLLIYKAVD